MHLRDEHRAPDRERDQGTPRKPREPHQVNPRGGTPLDLRDPDHTIGDEGEHDHVGKVVRGDKQHAQRPYQDIGAPTRQHPLDANEDERQEQRADQRSRPVQPVEEAGGEDIRAGTAQGVLGVTVASQRIEAEEETRKIHADEDERLVGKLRERLGDQRRHERQRLERQHCGHGVSAVAHAPLPLGNDPTAPRKERPEDLPQPASLVQE